MYDTLHITPDKENYILQARDQYIQYMAFSPEILVILYEEPEGSPRPRARFVNKGNLSASAKANPGFIQVYSITGAADRKPLTAVLDPDFDESYANKAKKININLEGSEESEIDLSGYEMTAPTTGSQGSINPNNVYSIDNDELDLTKYGSTDDMHNGPGVLNKRDFSDKIKDKKKEIKKKKATTMLKCILYFAMCLDDCWTLEDMIKQCEENESIERMA